MNKFVLILKNLIYFIDHKMRFHLELLKIRQVLLVFPLYLEMLFGIDLSKLV